MFKFVKINIRSVKFCCLFVSLSTFVLDYISKYFIISTLNINESIAITSYINIFYIQNPGIIFGFFSHYRNFLPWILSMSTIFIIVVLLVMMYRSFYNSYFLSISFAMIIGGSLGNLLDRLIHGSVTDFIDLYIYDWHWPTFNIADFSIFLGVTSLMIQNFLHVKKN